MAEETRSGVSPADDAARLEQISTELGQVDVTLRRLDDGSYGSCEVCGVRLDAAIVSAEPLTARCAQHLF